MTELILSSIKFPAKLKSQAQNLVKRGYFKSFSDVVIFATRMLMGKYPPWHAADEVRKMREEMWKDVLERAGGDEDKAADLMFQDLKEVEKRSPVLSRLKSVNQ